MLLLTLLISWLERSERKRDSVFHMETTMFVIFAFLLLLANFVQSTTNPLDDNLYEFYLIHFLKY